MTELAANMWQELQEKSAARVGQLRGTGLELKFPTVKAGGEAIGMEELQALWFFLADRGWEPIIDPYYGMAVGVQRPGEHREDVIGTETGICKLELSLGYKEDLLELQENLQEVQQVLAEFGEEQGVAFLGLGVQPLTPPGPQLMMPKSRNLFWEQVFGNKQVHLFTVTASNQVHVDVLPEEAVDAVNVFNGLAAAQIAVNANSTVWQGEVSRDFKALAEQAWEWWLPGSPRVGQTVRPFRDLEDYVDHLASYRPVYIRRGEDYLSLEQYASFQTYWEAGEDAVAGDAAGRRVPVVPVVEDWELHQTFCWHDARISGYGTLENRVNCEQPPGCEMVVAALTLGLMEKLDEAGELLAEFSWAELAAAREQAIRLGLQAKVGERPVGILVREMLALARRGLLQRGRGEEVFLESLGERLEREECPADLVRAVATTRGIDALINDFTWAP